MTGASAGRARSVTTLIIGGGHSGLAMSKRLSDRGVDHVVLERGQVANSWRTQRWDSLRLLTPNFQSRLPGHAYDGDDPDGFMAMPEVIDFINGYADRIDAPVLTDTEVSSVRPTDGGYAVATNQGPWQATTVVLASGPCNVSTLPACAEGVPDGIEMVSPLDYKNPDDLPEGGVLVVGASATGAQLAQEIHRSGRPVTMSVGEHVRMPRRYRGRDIMHWMEAIGRLDERYDEVDDLTRARKVASPQLVGTPERATLDLNALTAEGVTLRGRLGMVRDGVAMFSGGLRNACALADLKMGRLLKLIDEWITEHDLEDTVDAPERFPGTVIEPDVPLTLDLSTSDIRSIVWATGFGPDYSWLDVDVVDDKGRVRHDGGVVDAPGMYILGTSFLRRRKSTFIHGAADDTADLSEHLVGYLQRR